MNYKAKNNKMYEKLHKMWAMMMTTGLINNKAKAASNSRFGMMLS